MLAAWGAMPGSSGVLPRTDGSHRVTVIGAGHDWIGRLATALRENNPAGVAFLGPVEVAETAGL